MQQKGEVFLGISHMSHVWTSPVELQNRVCTFAQHGLGANLSMGETPAWDGHASMVSDGEVEVVVSTVSDVA